MERRSLARHDVPVCGNALYKSPQRGFGLRVRPGLLARDHALPHAVSLVLQSGHVPRTPEASGACRPCIKRIVLVDSGLNDVEGITQAQAIGGIVPVRH